MTLGKSHRSCRYVPHELTNQQAQRRVVQIGACVRAWAWFFKTMGRIDTLHGLLVTGSVNRLRPVERSQCER